MARRSTGASSTPSATASGWRFTSSRSSARRGAADRLPLRADPV